MTTQRFPLADILSVTTGYLLSHSRMDGVHRILTFLTGDDCLMTHQLPAACEAMAPVLLRQLPWLASLSTPPDGPSEEKLAWRDWAELEYGTEHEVTAAPEVWGTHNPIQDLVDIVGPDRVIPVVIAPSTPEDES